MHIKTKTNTELPQKMRSTLKNKFTTTGSTLNNKLTITEPPPKNGQQPTQLFFKSEVPGQTRRYVAAFS